MNLRHQTTSRPHRLLTVFGLFVLLGLSVTACSIEDAQPAPDCIEGNTVNLGAQSVPTAQLVPCFDTLPDGWDVDNVRIDQDGTEVRFDSDRAGDDAAVFHYTASCHIGDAVSARSEHDAADRFDHIEQVAPSFRAQRYYVFEGGCIWWEFDFDDDATAALSIELGERLSTITRERLNEIFRESFIDEPL
jgi:hypothetical protein